MSDGRQTDPFRTSAAAYGRRVNRPLEPAAVGRRIRAALVLAGRSPLEIAPELNISARTLDRTLSGQRQAREWELQRLAELLEVPYWFLLRGFEGLPLDSAATQETELRALDAKIDRDVIPRLEDLAMEIRALRTGVPR